VTQEFLGLMLGARRATVNEAMRRLVKSGSIAHRRGRVRVLDRELLETNGTPASRRLSRRRPAAVLRGRRRDGSVPRAKLRRRIPRPNGMRISPPAAMVGIFAALSGWMVRGIQFEAEASPIPVPISNAAPLVAQKFEAPLQVETPVYASHAERSTRNLFAYPEREVPVVQRAVFRPMPPIAAAPVIVAPQPVEERPRVRFAHRYIGRFGPDHRPIAAFARDGQIVTARIGERIDERFVLRSIGMESVEVETSVNGEVQSERVTLGESSR
jgi:hypothetical protein